MAFATESLTRRVRVVWNNSIQSEPIECSGFSHAAIFASEAIGDNALKLAIEVRLPQETAVADAGVTVGITPGSVRLLPNVTGAGGTWHLIASQVVTTEAELYLQTNG